MTKVSRESLNERIEWLRDRANSDLLRNGRQGIEKESLRVSADGRLSQRRHPVALGSALTHPSITTDYSEALLELVTPPKRAAWQSLQYLCDLHAFVHQNIDDELLWPMSMPCIVDANREIPIAEYGTSNAGMLKTVYRRGLGYRYGRAMQAIAGVHFNYSPPEIFWPAYHEFSASEQSLAEFKSRELMGLIRNFRRNAWLALYLFGASPAFCKSFRPERHELVRELNGGTWYAPYATSLRMSDLGYQNRTQARLAISANSLDEYVGQLTGAVTTLEPAYEKIGIVVDGEYRQLNANLLQIENEYYSVIRAKPKKSQRRAIAALRDEGVEYVEVRILDLNPRDPVGINQAQLRMLELLLIACLLTPSPPISRREQQEIDDRTLLVAQQGRRPGLSIPFRGADSTVVTAGLEIFAVMETVAELLDGDDCQYRDALGVHRAALDDPELTPSAVLLAELMAARTSFFDYALEIAIQHHEYFLAMPLDPEKTELFQMLTIESLGQLRALEAGDGQEFEAFLADLRAEL